jgi:hypothetical protein
LSTVKEMYEQCLSVYSKIEDDLTDPQLNYHQYFARVYNL